MLQLKKTCGRWFARFRSGDFHLEDKERPGQPKKLEDEKLQALLVTADRYLRQLNELAKKLIEKRPLIARKHHKVVFHDDNVRPHRAKIVKEKKKSFGWDHLDHPPYSPDIAPSDYYLFRLMQISLADVRFRNAEEVRKWVDEWIASKDEDFFKRGINKLPRRWEEIITNVGQYIG